MHTFKLVLRQIGRTLHKWRLMGNKSIQLGSRVTVSRNTTLEGNNIIGDNVTLSNTVIGRGTFLSRDDRIVNTRIGRFSSIGAGVTTVIGNHPTKQFVSTHPAFYSTRKQAGFTFATEQLFEDIQYVPGSPYCVEIGSDMWIGDDVKILNGVRIGDGAVVAADAFVNKDVAPYSIVGGLPAHHIRDRFTPEERDFLLANPWFDRDFDWIQAHADKMTDIKQYIKAGMQQEAQAKAAQPLAEKVAKAE